MIRPAKDRKKKLRRRKKANSLPDGTPKPKPEWAEAFLVFLLAKVGGSVSLSAEQLDRYSSINSDNSTKLEYDDGVVTLSLDGLRIKKSSIFVPKRRIAGDIANG